MLFHVTAIRDAKSKLFSTPMFFTTPAVAIRSFGDAVTGKESDFSRHPEDYSMYLLGTYEDSSGRFQTEVEPAFLISATNLVPE